MGIKIEKRFWSKVKRGLANKCWVWTSDINWLGYGGFRVQQNKVRKRIPAHRFAYELRNGPVPSGLELDHLCRNRACVNPAHLEAVSHRVNIRRSPLHNANKTHCKHGHPFTPENTYVLTRGERVCRICQKQRTDKYLHRGEGRLWG